MLGLTLTEAGSVAVSGQKIRRYRIDAAALGQLVRVIESREGGGAWQFMARHCGSGMDAHSDDVSEHVAN